MSGATRNTAVCESCGARNSHRQADGSYACTSCGWVQRPRDSTAPTIPKKHLRWLTLVVIVVLMVVAGLAWTLLRPPPPAPAAKTPAPASSVPAPAPLPKPDPLTLGNRMVTVPHPEVRELDEGLQWSLSELFATGLPLFDSSKLELGKFERIIDETGLPTYRAELVNRSKDTIVLNPRMDLRLYATDGSSQVPRHIGGMPPMLYPGESAWIKVGDEEDIKPIKRAEVTWHASRRLPLPGPRSKADIEVKSHNVRTCSKRIINSHGSYSFSYPCAELVGTLHNTDTRSMTLAGIAVFYFDAQDRYVGSESINLDDEVKPGQRVDFQIGTTLLRGHGYKRHEIHYYAKQAVMP